MSQTVRRSFSFTCFAYRRICFYKLIFWDLCYMRPKCHSLLYFYVWVNNNLNPELLVFYFTYLTKKYHHNLDHTGVRVCKIYDRTSCGDAPVPPQTRCRRQA